MTKCSISIHPEKEKPALAYLVKKLGMPVCYEDLTIYFISKEISVKVSVQPLENLLVSFRKSTGEELYRFSARPEEIKDVIKSLCLISDGLGYISISAVKKFSINNNDHLSIINTKDAGCICSFYGSNTKLINEISKKYALPTRPTSEAPLESIISFDVSSEGILNSKILQYLERNGIFYKSNNGNPTYRELMHRKSNDYSLYESAFEMLTGRSIVDSRRLENGENFAKGQSVSIIIPYRNSESSILQVLASIDAQNGIKDFKFVEVIIVDDNSSIPLAKEHNLEKLKYQFDLRVIRTESNAGVSIARKVGTALSSGELLFYMDSDILLDKNYLIEHTARMLAIPNAVFVSLRGRVEATDPRISMNKIKTGLERPTSFHDLRVYKKVEPSRSVGVYKIQSSLDLNILESTNYLKNFNGSRVYGVYDLSCMVAGHNFSTRRSNVENTRPFSSAFKGWGMEDVYAGLRFIGNGIYIVPVISTGVYHIDHPPRSGSVEKKNEEYVRNTAIINDLLDSEFDR